MTYPGFDVPLSFLGFTSTGLSSSAFSDSCEVREVRWTLFTKTSGMIGTLSGDTGILDVLVAGEPPFALLHGT